MNYWEPYGNVIFILNTKKKKKNMLKGGSGRTFAKFETLHIIYSHTSNMNPLLWRLNVTHNGG
jgi:hypothetical protein